MNVLRQPLRSQPRLELTKGNQPVHPQELFSRHSVFRNKNATNGKRETKRITMKGKEQNYNFLQTAPLQKTPK